MNIILNFVPLKSGGGVQVGLDFIAQLKQHDDKHKWYLVATEGTPFEQCEETDRFRMLQLVKRDVISRTWFEHVGCRPIVGKARAAIIYTQFGPQWPGASVAQVAGCAYSNLLYPDLNFWAGLPLIARLKKAFIDKSRLRRIKSADAVIFENKTLADRAIYVIGLNPSRVFHVRPAVSSLIALDTPHCPTADRTKEIPRGFRILLLSTYNINKRMEMIPPVASILREKYGLSNVIFVLTLPPELKATRMIISEAKRSGVAGNVFNLGPVPPEGCSELYRACNATVLPSRLESFSNNIAESWFHRLPMFISDLDWAHSACGDGAIYFRHGDPESLAEQIASSLSRPSQLEDVAKRGLAMLQTYPNGRERFEQYRAIIERVAADSQRR